MPRRHSTNIDLPDNLRLAPYTHPQLRGYLYALCDLHDFRDSCKRNIKPAPRISWVKVGVAEILMFRRILPDPSIPLSAVVPNWSWHRAPSP
jgi:hypothetical protein